MVTRPWVAVVLLGALGSLGAQYRTQNFVVDAPTQPIAERVGQWAEYYRREKALQWLGREIPAWGQPCPLRVTVAHGSSGATSFVFDRGQILSMEMNIEGTLDRLIYSVLPHEVTHTVFASHFRRPVPRWADEGGSVLSEDDQERARHDSMVRQILSTPGRAIPLRRLFALTKYPPDVMVLYAEGYSVTNFLVGRSSRGAFLNFVGDGMSRGWDEALQAHYGYKSIEELEQVWVQSLRQPTAPTTLASAAGRGAGERVVERRTLPPATPVLGAPRPVARGVAPSEGDRWAVPSAAGPSKPPVRLGAPRPLPAGSPVGYSP